MKASYLNKIYRAKLINNHSSNRKTLNKTIILPAKEKIRKLPAVIEAKSSIQRTTMFKLTKVPIKKHFIS